MLRRILLFSFFMLLSLFSLNAQELALRLGSTYEIELKNGKIHQGKLLQVQEEVIVIEDQSQVINHLPKSYIKKLRLLEESRPALIQYNPYGSSNASEVRYFINSSGFGLRKGEGYYQNSYLVVNSVHFGITDYFSIGAAMDFYSLSQGHPYFAIIPKFSLPLQNNLRLGVNIAYVGVTWDSWAGIAAFLPQISYGSPQNNITAGIGMAFATGDSDLLTVFNLSGMAKLSNRVSFVSENYVSRFDSDWGYLLSYGLRFQAAVLSADLGLINNSSISSDWIVGVPYVGFAVKF